MPAQKERDDSVWQYGLDFSREEDTNDQERKREKLKELGIQPATSRPKAAIHGERVKQRSAFVAFLARLYRRVRRVLG